MKRSSEEKWVIKRVTYPRSGSRKDPKGWIHHWYAYPPPGLVGETDPYPEHRVSFTTWKQAYCWALQEAKKRAVINEFSSSLTPSAVDMLYARYIRYRRFGPDALKRIMSDD
jgi:hypothetical protein